MTPIPFSIDPSKPYATYVNNSDRIDQSMPEAADKQQAIEAFPGDPLVGVVISPSSGLKWENATQVQMAIYEYYKTLNLPVVDAEIDSNPGPNAPWNWSYAQWGLVPPPAA